MCFLVNRIREYRFSFWMTLIGNVLSLVLSTALDLVDLSEPCERRWSWDRWSPRGSRKNGFSKSSLRKKKTEETELIQVETEPSSPSRSNPERASLDSGILLVNERYFGNVVKIHHNSI